MPICENCGSYFSRLPCPVCGLEDQIGARGGDLLVQQFMDAGIEEERTEKTRRILFFGKVANEPFRMELVIKTYADIDLILDESSLFAGKLGKFERPQGQDQEYIDTVETVIKHLHAQLEAKSIQIAEYTEDSEALRSHIERLEAENYALKKRLDKDILSEEKLVEEAPGMLLEEVKGVGPKTSAKLKEYGISTVSEFLNVKSLDSLAAKTGIGSSLLRRIRENAEAIG